MSTTPWFVFAGGGTGGHLYPALAVVEALRAAGAVDVSFFCTQRPIDREILGKADVEAVPQVVIPVPARPWLWPGFYLKWRQSVRACMDRFRQRRPMAVVGAGGYASGPPVSAALTMGIPTFLLNPDAVPGKANRHMGRKKGVTGIFAQWEVTRQYFPAGAPVRVTGCPVRGAFRQRVEEMRGQAGGETGRQGDKERRGQGEESGSGGRGLLSIGAILESFGLEAGRRTLLVTGASQGARTINEAVILLAPSIAAAGWQILHLAGAAECERVEAAYARLAGGTEGLRYKVLAFTDRMPEAMTACDLIVSRAGASSLAEIQAAGKPSILLPYPFHKDRHQWHNAEVLVNRGAALLVDDVKDGGLNAQALQPVLDGLLRDDARREAMGRAARELDRPDAGEVIARALWEGSEHVEK